jgi:ABC-type dipeptide/oligopeptide/nickel transport system permease component
MLTFAVNRLVRAILTLAGASILAFLVLRGMPSDPVRLIVGPFANDQTIAAMRSELGLDQPLYLQYFTYIGKFVRGDWGFSFSVGQPVLEHFADRLPASAELALYAFLIAFVGAVAIAVLASYSRSRVADASVRGFALICLGIPPFWLSLVLLIVFFEHLGWLPGPIGRGPEPATTITGLYTVDALLGGQWAVLWADLRSLALPAIALALAPMGFLARLLRANLQEVEHEPFVTVLSAKGVPRLAIHMRHILPNAFLPTLTAAGLILAQLLGGSVLVERVFAWPGIGGYIMDGILRQDYSAVQAFILLSAAAYVVVNLVVDLLYGWIDPRIRQGGGRR